MSAPRVITTSLGGGAVARALLDGTRATWLAPRPADVEEWRAHVEQVRAEPRGDWRAVLDPALGAHGAAAERLERVSRGGGVLVTTGQQPGLFGGPMLTWNKALAALALADALQDALGVPTCPLFWAATDDADLAEASVTHVAVRGGLETLRLERAAPEGTSVRDIPLGDVSGLIDALTRATGAAVDPSVLDRLRTAYTADATIGGAYITLLRGLLEPMGMPVLDAGDPAVRRAVHPFLVRALEQAGDGDRALSARTTEMRAAGFEPQVAQVPSLTMIFQYGSDGRRRVPIESASSVARVAAPGTLGPNVLLRPVMERALLPTVAYVAGPGEIAYFAQATAVAAALDAAAPVAMPRWSALIVEPHIDRILARYDLTVEDVRSPGLAERLLARRALPASVTDALARTRVRLTESVQELMRAAADSGLSLPPAVVKGLEATVGRRLDRFERRVLAAQKRRDRQTMEDVATARAALFPLEQPQERALNLLPLLARHGMPLLDAMLDGARAHARLLVEGMPAASIAERLPR